MEWAGTGSDIGIDKSVSSLGSIGTDTSFRSTDLEQKENGDTRLWKKLILSRMNKQLSKANTSPNSDDVSGSSCSLSSNDSMGSSIQKLSGQGGKLQGRDQEATNIKFSDQRGKLRGQDQENTSRGKGLVLGH